MRSFPRLSFLYSTWKTLIESQSHSCVQIILNREVTRVKRHSGLVEVWSRVTKGTDNNQEVIEPGQDEMETFDEIIFCTDADAALKILGGDASWLERKILGNVKVGQK
jgi:predicted NAD/FAD-binding protein